MASQQSIVDYILEQMGDAGEVSAKKMFGEYGVYCDGKFVALICDDTLFIKPTPEAIAYAGDLEQAPPYKGAKSSLVIPESKIEDDEWLSKLVAISTAALPFPKKRSPKKKK